MSTCKAYLRGQQYFCDHCGTTWDMDDSAPPTCTPVTVVHIPLPTDPLDCINRNIGNKSINNIKDILK